MATIVPLSAIDPALVEELLDAAFGDGRHARTAYRIRERMDWLEALSFAALDFDRNRAGFGRSAIPWPGLILSACRASS